MSAYSRQCGMRETAPLSTHARTPTIMDDCNYQSLMRMIDRERGLGLLGCPFGTIVNVPVKTSFEF